MSRLRRRPQAARRRCATRDAAARDEAVGGAQPRCAAPRPPERRRARARPAGPRARAASPPRVAAKATPARGRREQRAPRARRAARRGARGLRRASATRARSVGRLERRAPDPALPGAPGDALQHRPAAQPQLWVRIYPDDCLDRHLRGDAVRARGRQRAALLGRHLARGRRSRRASAAPGAAWSPRTARAAPAGSSTPTGRSTPGATPGQGAARPTCILDRRRRATPLPAAEATALADLLARDVAGRRRRRRAQQARSRARGARSARRAPPSSSSTTARSTSPTRPTPPRTRGDVAVQVACFSLPAATAGAAAAVVVAARRASTCCPSASCCSATGGRRPAGRALGGAGRRAADRRARPVADAGRPAASSRTAATLHVPDELRWMVDFERAVEVGMGFAHRPHPAAGRARLRPPGRARAAPGSDRPTAGPPSLERLLDHHRARPRRARRSCRRARRPTTPRRRGAGYRLRATTPTRASTTCFAQAPLYRARRRTRCSSRDGQWLAELLGLDPDLVAAHPRQRAGATSCDARAMQIALWPATLGYWMDDAAGAGLRRRATSPHTRCFFTRYVSGRGPLPAIRIGAPALRDPADHRVLADRAGSGAAPRDLGSGASDRVGYLRACTRSCARVECRLGGDGRRRRRTSATRRRRRTRPLLDILGLHPRRSSIHYALRRERSSTLFNRAQPVRRRLATSLGAARCARDLARQPPTACSPRLGYAGAAAPDILQHYFLRRRTSALDGPLVDDRPLSETRPDPRLHRRRPQLHPVADRRRRALARRRCAPQQGFADGKPPQALLYLLLRHALMLGYHDASCEPAPQRGLAHRRRARRDEARAGLRARRRRRRAASESRFAPLYAAERADHRRARRCRSTRLHRAQPAGDLAERPALRRPDRRARAARRRPTARLERAFAEHVDTCTYRLDAWLLGLVNLQLEAMRRRGDGDEGDRARRASTSAPTPGSRTCGPSTTRADPGRSSRPTIWPRSSPADEPPLDARHAPTTATSTRRRSTTPSPPRCCATATSPTRRRTPRTRWPSTCRPSACGWRSAHPRGHPRRARASARCSATGSSAACTTATPSPRSTGSSIRCARRSRSSADQLQSTTDRDAAVSIEAIEARNVARRPQAGRARPQHRRRRLSVRPRPRRRPRAQRRRSAAHQRRGAAAARRPRRGRRPRARRGRPPGGAGQLRPRRRDARRLHTGQLPARPRGRRARRRPAIDADPPRRAPPRRPGLAAPARRHAARAGRAGARRLARRPSCRRSTRSAASWPGRTRSTAASRRSP